MAEVKDKTWACEVSLGLFAGITVSDGLPTPCIFIIVPSGLPQVTKGMRYRCQGARVPVSQQSLFISSIYITSLGTVSYLVYTPPPPPLPEESLEFPFHFLTEYYEELYQKLRRTLRIYLFKEFRDFLLTTFPKI